MATLQDYLKNKDKIFLPTDPPEMKERLASRLWIRFVKPKLDTSLTPDELEQSRSQFVGGITGGTVQPLSPGFGRREPEVGLGAKIAAPIGSAAAGMERSLQNALRFFGANKTAETWAGGTRKLEEAIAPGVREMPLSSKVAGFAGEALPMIAGFEAGAAAVPFGAAKGAPLIKGAIQNIPKAIAGGIASSPTTAQDISDVPAEAAKMAVLGPLAEVGLGAAFRAPGALSRAIGKGAAPVAPSAAGVGAAAPTGMAYFEDLAQKLFNKTFKDLAPAEKTKLGSLATQLSAFESRFGVPTAQQEAAIIGGKFAETMKEAASAAKAAKAAAKAAKTPGAKQVITKPVVSPVDKARRLLIAQQTSTVAKTIRARTGVVPSEDLLKQVEEMAARGQSEKQILENLQIAIPEEIAKKVAVENPQVIKAVEAVQSVAPSTETIAPAIAPVAEQVTKVSKATVPKVVKTTKAPEPKITLEQLREAQVSLNEAAGSGKMSADEFLEKAEILQARIDKMLGVKEPKTVSEGLLKASEKEIESGKVKGLQTVKAAKRTRQRQAAMRSETLTQQEQQLGGGKRTAPKEEP